MTNKHLIRINTKIYEKSHLWIDVNLWTASTEALRARKKKALLRPDYSGLRRAKVELEGVEPSSKQGTDVISTCLSFYWLSGVAREEAPKTKPYSLYLVRQPGPLPNQPEIVLRPVIRPESGISICGTSRPAPGAGLSLSTKLRLSCECEFWIAN